MDLERIEKAVREILLAVGEDPEREGLQETPNRVARMYAEIFSGLKSDPKQHLKIFHERSTTSSFLCGTFRFYSVCEHHLLPFIGKCHIAYIPRDGKIIGLSKFARIVDCFARRPQVQERLTAQIADFIEENLNPRGVAVFVEAEHLCMTMRGARAAGALTQTSAQARLRAHGGRQTRNEACCCRKVRETDMTEFYAAGKRFPLNRAYVMGILNVTPDSFSDGGKYFDPEKAVRHAVEMEAQGVDIVDIGGQSTRPGSVRISPEEEWARIENVVKAVAEKTNLLFHRHCFNFRRWRKKPVPAHISSTT